ncbi:hypothetical protein [Microbacterium sp. PAMC21962]|uniref:hypothetical protein n=1 Tax=Microbacterium sp. PAMC21962 TaxID=2861280 RepID=UPI001C632006|nr:hypothetical protein [Microbacterium sp. PAMC21962]QYF98478.1 hypothetical protein KY498_04325 [Microbacterium sp. PAMC21962]
MSKKEHRPIQVGDRFETRDRRDAGRIVEVVEALGIRDRGRQRLARIEAGPDVTCWGEAKADLLRWVREQETIYRIRTITNPRVPHATGRHVKVQENTLRAKYKRVSD